ncbi:acyl-CoA dehydrogenase C-terminal domain-containing protein [Teredinibacter sp. KSP-S5-2]|uniref:acyl-CoA dehydrogenase C-terminal domain-containing protein n=1 Tax=Teredinibacter sp. KSP-S5-2 TaxID=3034506 RepID=UPI002934B100|nr:acyl-CoA dehydrogenase C-terminal domain-containing protein [Teredinibacter sp. KSP-S5-2]WNO08703.1 acyl-CoA dehydrogenase C-terminal domain-containing protein [Teredinibacter sp. KSP-S5-2]
MADYRAPVEDIVFLLRDVFRAPEMWQELLPDSELDMDTAEAILSEAGKICEGVIAPLNREADEQGCQWQEGEVIPPSGFPQAYQTYCDGGWGALGGNPEFGGMGMPKTLMSGVEEMLQGACMSFGLLPMLTSGATLALDAHASEEIKQTYLPKMYSGEWSGVMDLTEPHAGTDLGLIRTRAEPDDDGSYRITGTKIFITWGEQNITSNIIHLVLAKLPDAPEGTKGISLFLVPKRLLNEQGEPSEKNSLSCGSLEKKMGIKASATCVMNFDGAKGWLIGAPNKGLACMFTMMNYERLVVGVQGLANGEAAYQGALAYAKERVQGRSAEGAKQPDKPADSIMVHPDVRRMLLNAKSMNEAGRAFYLYVAYWLDVAKFSRSAEQKQKADNMVAFLTPVAKAFLTDTAFLSTLDSQMVFGGHGYIREWGQEQYVRDTRITQIYEGTNGVQAMDLIGRKTLSAKGVLLGEFVEDIQDFIDTCEEPQQIKKYEDLLLSATKRLQKVTDELLASANDNPNLAGAVGVDYLHFVGYVCFAYMWVRMIVPLASNVDQSRFAQSKIKTADYFFAKVLPVIDSLEKKILAGPDTIMAINDELF